LGDVADLITKGTTPTSAGFQFTTSGVNFIKAENVSDSGHILPAKMFISDECNEALRRSQFETGDLLVTIAGAIGRIGIVLEKNLPANTNQAVAIVRIPLSSAITRRMLFYWLHSNHIQSIFRSSVTTGAQPNINLKQIGDLPLKIPSSAEQDMIVAALDAASQEVDVIVADLTKLRTEKKALMQQLLTGKRRVVV
jgi:type I restriction enzyme S subunit